MSAMTMSIDAGAAAAVPVPSPRVGRVRAYQTIVDVWEDHYDHEDKGLRDVVAGAVVARLRARGFTAHRSKKWSGRWDGVNPHHLEVYVECTGRHLKVEFFQNIANVENKNGGEYDFDKFARMPRTMQLRCVVEMANVMRTLLGLGYSLGGFDHRWPASDYDTTRLAHSILRVADGRNEREETPLAHFNRGWGADRFERDETGWISPKEYRRWEARDRDGKELRAGDVKFMRAERFGGDGRLRQVTVYPSVNGQWLAFSNGVQVGWCVQANEYFDCDRPDLEPRRRVGRQVERLESELEKAMKAKSWPRVAVLADVLRRAARAEAAR